jgi:excisionase family DNA binding protein
MSRTAYCSQGGRPRSLWKIVAGMDPHQASLFTVREVAGQLGVHPETIRRLIHDGRLDAVRVGRVLRVDADALQGFLARQRVKPTRMND